MWFIALCGVPGSGKSFFRERLTKSIKQRQMEAWDDFAQDAKSGPLNEHELTKLNYFKNFRISEVSADDYIDEIARRQNSTYSEIFNLYSHTTSDLFWHQLGYSIACRSNVIIADRTFITEAARAKLFSNVELHETVAGVTYKKMVIDFATPPNDEWRERLASRPGKDIPEKTLLDMDAAKTPPRKDTNVRYNLVVELIHPENQPTVIERLAQEVLNVPELSK